MAFSASSDLAQPAERAPSPRPYGERAGVRGGGLLRTLKCVNLNAHGGLKDDVMRREQPWKTNRARALRVNATSAENRLWQRLRNRQLDGLRFTRQMPIDPWFADFVCRSHRVVVEIDGATHSTPEEIANDAARTRGLEALGYRVFRVYNDDVRRNVTGVLDAILEFVNQRPASD